MFRPMQDESAPNVFKSRTKGVVKRHESKGPPIDFVQGA